MRITSRVLSSAAAIAITCVVSAAAYFYKNRKSEVNEVMVFCKLQFNAYNYFDKLISFIESAKKSVNVCMPGIHNPVIQGRLVTLLKEKNIKVRMIIDRTGYNESTDFFIRELIECGAEVRCNATDPAYTMQHKFCLVDDRILMTGTLNWGNDRSFDNWNYVYITTKSQLVVPVKKEFYQMWQKTSDIENLYETELGDNEIATPASGDSDVVLPESGNIEMPAYTQADNTIDSQSIPQIVLDTEALEQTSPQELAFEKMVH
ncbi:mitochondrial cardiolipin hydrolase-like [Pieris brassicae]|uniref:mitochondrial cardiolipin hydrolase-like n=1 Tax=Pieris brassicae TaxID=7116 RepID=UPI001E6616E6|nr:mitochondrial cardiolipin hydrolase-like [Pieris brassicae]